MATEKDNLKEDDLVLATVKKIENNTVFLELENGQEGSMTFGEVSPGRIRNIREFVVLNKKIVCKVLRIKDNHPELSLRRVTAKERENVMASYKKIKSLETILKPILKEKTSSTLKKIEASHDLAEFYEKARENPSIISNFVTKSEAEELQKRFSEKREKEKEIKKTITIKTQGENGIEQIKQVLTASNSDIRYLGSSKFSVSLKDKDFKTAEHKLNTLLEEMSKKAKAMKMQFEIK